METFNENWKPKLENIDISNLCDYKLKFINLRHKYTENFRFEKTFVNDFVNLTILNNKIPTQKEFLNYYITINKDYLINNFLIYENKKLLFDSLIARLYRAYPSLVRDIHFIIFASKYFDVFYNPKLDIEQGIDCLINNKYALRMYTNTKLSIENRIKKDKRRTYSTEYSYIDLPINLSNDKIVGEFYLYNYDDIEYIKKTIK